MLSIELQMQNLKIKTLTDTGAGHNLLDMLPIHKPKLKPQ